MKWSTLIALAMFIGGTAGFSVAYGEEGMPEPTKEQRETMAKHHEEMASCLRSDKAAKECREIMMKMHKDCPGGCGKMGHMGKAGEKGKKPGCNCQSGKGGHH